MTGLCECGCGQPTRLAPYSSKRLNWTKGEPQHFIHGHATKGKRWQQLDAGYVVDLSTGCWVWIRAHNGRGYGSVRIDNRTRPAHIVFYEREHGAVPDGLELDHLCRNTACVNPDHLEPVTHAENVRRGANTKLTVIAAREVRSLAQGGWLRRDIAVAYGISTHLVKAISRGLAWRGV